MTGEDDLVTRSPTPPGAPLVPQQSGSPDARPPAAAAAPVAQGRSSTGPWTRCAYEDCTARSVVRVVRAGARHGRVVCDTHAHTEVLMAERYSYDVTVTAWQEPPPALF